MPTKFGPKSKICEDSPNGTRKTTEETVEFIIMAIKCYIKFQRIQPLGASLAWLLLV